MYEALKDAEEAGYKIENLKSKSGQNLVWNQETDRFEIVKNADANYKYWKAYKEVPSTQNFSIYLNDKTFASAITVSVGFDAGENSAIPSVSYSHTSGDTQNVIIRTNGGTLNVNAPNDSMKHYGNLDTLNVTAINTSTYHENGSVVNVANLTAGRIVVEKGAYIKEVAADSSAAVVVEGYVNTVTGTTATGTGYVPNNNGSTLGNPDAVKTTISSVADLHMFRDKVNEGAWDANLTATLAADLDLTGVAWAPIGKKAHPFVGTFNGANHKIVGLTNADYVMGADEIEPSNYSGNVGGSYGFFGVIGGDTATSISNLTLENVNISIKSAKNIGGLFGADAQGASASGNGGQIDIKNITVSGSIQSTDYSGATLGGIGGKVYNAGRTNVLNCTNYANIIATDGHSGDIKASGIIGFTAYATAMVIDGCKNYGDVSAKTTTNVYAAGIVNKSSGTVYVANCSTQGVFTLEAPTVYYSVIARGQNANNMDTGETEQFEGITYHIYDDFAPATSIRSYNNSISNESGYNAFKATIKEGDASRELTSSYAGLDLLKLYNNSYNL